MTPRTKTALRFLQLARAGNRAEAERLMTPTARHHNPHFASGMSALLDAIAAADAATPQRSFDVKHTVAEEEYVAIHSHVRHAPDSPGVAVVHLFRFEGSRIAELWDVGQAVPADTLNADGMF